MIAKDKNNVLIIKQIILSSTIRIIIMKNIKENVQIKAKRKHHFDINANLNVICQWYM